MTSFLLVLLVSFQAFAAAPEFVSDPQIIFMVESDNVRGLQKKIEAGEVGINSGLGAAPYSQAPGIPVIGLAAREASLNVIRYLVGAGADLNKVNSIHETPMTLAAFFKDDNTDYYDRHEQAVRLLAEAGASLEGPARQYGPLAYASYAGHDSIVRYLVEKGARVDADAENGKTWVNTPLMMASMMGHKKIVHFLLLNGANVRIEKDSGRTAIELAKKYNQTHLLPHLECAWGLQQGQRYADHCQ